MSTAKKEYKRITTKTLVDMKSKNEKIAMLTAYDYTMAKILDNAGIDVILVGDSASNVMAGHETTLPITLNEMIYHASSVVRAIDRSLVVVDLPFVPVMPISVTLLRKPPCASASANKSISPRISAPAACATRIT